MGEMFTVKVTGIKELKKKFEQIDISLQQILYEATAEGAGVVVREAGINSQRGGDEFPNRITGNLLRSIKMLHVEKKPTRCTIKVGSAMAYALRLEKGFMDTDSRGRRYHQKARPFLRPALDEFQDEIQDSIGATVRDFIKLVT